MKIVYMGNNYVGWKVLEWLKTQHCEIVSLILHPPERQKFGEDIKNNFSMTHDRIFYGNQLKDSDVLAAIRQFKPDLGLSVYFGHILRTPFLSIFPKGVINLHPSYLPYNRGSFPNVWSIIEGTPAGSTLHYIDEEIDTGDIISQKLVKVEPVDTGETLYRKLENASIDLFKESWPSILEGKISIQKQNLLEGTMHRLSDIKRIDRIELDQKYTAREIINRIRARTFPPHKGCYIEEEGKRVYLRLETFQEEINENLQEKVIR